MPYAIQRKDGKVWAHDGGPLGGRPREPARSYSWMDEAVLWSESIGRPATWGTRRGVDHAMALPNFKSARVIEIGGSHDQQGLSNGQAQDDTQVQAGAQADEGDPAQAQEHEAAFL